MERILMIICCVLITSTYAQDKLEKDVGEFKSLKVYDRINVDMIKSDTNKVVISGEDVDDVEFVNRNGKLKIRMNTEMSFNGHNVYITLFYTAVDVIDANEGAIIKVKETIDQYEIDLKTQEGAQITADLKVNYANLRAVTGGVVSTTGTAKNQDISIYTGGIYKGEKLSSEFAEVSIQAGGEAHVECSDRLEIRISAGGDVYIHGNPKLVDEKRVFGGRVKRVE